MSRSFIADTHSDLLQELAFAEHELGESGAFRSRWLGALEAGTVGLQVCAIYVDPELDSEAALLDALRQVRSFHRALDENADRLRAVRTVADLEGLGEQRLGLLLALEGASPLGQDPWLIDVFAVLGVRMASLTWNERNPFASGCLNDGGLTPLGARLVDRLLELGVAVDLAHASRQTFYDVLERDCGDRVLVSHASCRALFEHPRNLDDDQLVALRDRGGVLGVMPHPAVVDPRDPTIGPFLAHVDHAAEIMGVEHLALGGDFLRQIMRALGEQDDYFDGLPADAAIEGLEGPQDYPALVEALRKRGYDERALAAIFGGNLLRLLHRSLPR